MLMPQRGNRIIAALRQADDGPVRAYCAELAERIALPIYAAANPDDPRPAAILWTVKRFAEGFANDSERLAMRRVAEIWCEQVCPRDRCSATPAEHASQAIGFCLEKPTNWMFWGVLQHINELAGRPWEELYDEVAAALEAMPRKEEPVA
jgi:hypothetical protein